MKFCRNVLIVLMAVVAASEKTNAIGNCVSYHGIIDRNAFNLKALHIKAIVHAPSPNTIKLTGIGTIGGSKRVFLEITKPGTAKDPIKPVLGEGQSEAGVEVLEINAEKGLVRVKVDGLEMALTFERDGKADAPGTLGGFPQSPLSRSSAFAPATSHTPAYRGIVPLASDTRSVAPQTLEESILRVATMTELMADSVRRGEHPPFPPTDLTPNPPRVAIGNELHQSVTNVARRPRQ